MGFSFAIGFRFSVRRGVGACAASGAFSRSILGTGIGIGILVLGSMMVTMYCVAMVPSYEKLSESRFVLLSKSMLSAGCGPPNNLLRSGPQYAILFPGVGPGSR